MQELNRACIIGRLGNDPDLKYTQSGDSVASFSVANNTRWKDQNGEQKEKVSWIKCVAWKGLADTVAKYTRKGSKVAIEGKIETRSYEDKDGRTVYVTEIRVDNITFLDPTDKSGGLFNGVQEQKNGTSFDEAIPFSDDEAF